MSKQVKRAIIILGLLLLPFIVGLLFTYQVIKIPVPTDMAVFPGVNYQQGPRLLPAVGSVSTEGQPVVLGSVPDNPVPTDEVSLQRGEILYSVNCALCHGATAQGDGPISDFYIEYEADPPPDLTASNMFDGSIFRIITQGSGTMLPLAENMTQRERWDVVNYVQTLEIEE
jgi:mono/diheme cytochrome c family protein